MTASSTAVPNDQMFWQILPKELLNASNGTHPGTMELVAFEFGALTRSSGSAPGGTPPRLWDMRSTP